MSGVLLSNVCSWSTGGQGVQHIKPIFNSAFEKHLTAPLILNIAKQWVKLKENTIIFSKFSDREQIFGNIYEAHEAC